MKLLDLLEGSEKLFHLTKLEKLSDILVSGGLSCLRGENHGIHAGMKRA